MSEKMKWLEKYAPLGIDIRTEIGWYIVGVLVATLHSMVFFLQYLSARNEVYMRESTGLVLIEGAIMRDFASVTEGVFLSGILVCVVTLLMSIYHYLYHYQGSKMMYLMRRLPDKNEVVRRCITLPIAGATIMAVWMMVLKLVYYAVYILCTPSQCLPM